MIVLKVLSSLLKILGSGTKPVEVAWGFGLGAILGLTGFHGLFPLVLILILCLFRVNLSAALLSWLLYGLAAQWLDPVFHTIGYKVLAGIPFFVPFWTWLYNLPAAPFFRFNNTVFMGGLVMSLVLLATNVLLFHGLVVRFRRSWAEKVKTWKVARVLGSSNLVRWIIKLKGWGA